MLRLSQCNGLLLLIVYLFSTVILLTSFLSIYKLQNQPLASAGLESILFWESICDQTCNSEVDKNMAVPLSMDAICSVKV